MVTRRPSVNIMSYRVVVVLLLLLGVSVSSLELCTNITGVWRNSLGSRAILTLHSHGRIKGSYVTAVEVRQELSGINRCAS